MERRDVIKKIALLPIAGAAMKLNALNELVNNLDETEKMPLLFLGHGSPMNAIEENEFVKGFRKTGETISKPKAVLCISAHWETEGTRITAMAHPQTIHDFGGFPQALFDVEYPAPGNPELAAEIKKQIKKTEAIEDHQWGLDHGAWTVIKHLYPKADVPVLQMSLDYRQKTEYHYELANELSFLRKKGVLIVGSGNMVHNLRQIAWDKLNANNFGYDWALEASEKMKNAIQKNDHEFLINYKKQGKAFDLAVPTPEHFLPLLYILGLKEENEKIVLFNDKAVAGSLTMTSVKIG